MTNEGVIELAAKAIYENELRGLTLLRRPAWEDCADGTKNSFMDSARDAFAVFRAHVIGGSNEPGSKPVPHGGPFDELLEHSIDRERYHHGIDHEG